MWMRHIWMSIAWFERSLNEVKSYSWKNKRCKDLFEMTYWQVKKWLQEYKDKWFIVIPSDSCDNLRKDWTCWGHKD